MRKQKVTHHWKIFELVNKVDWRIVWYSIVLWILAIIVGGFVILPWYYPAFLLSVFFLTAAFFRKVEAPYEIYRRRQDQNLVRGLWTSLFWSTAVFLLDFFEFIGFNSGNALVYFSDSRNWFKYPVIILVPIIYSLILENINRKNFSSEQSRGPLVSNY